MQLRKPDKTATSWRKSKITTKNKLSAIFAGMIILSRFEHQLPSKQLQKGFFYFEEEMVCNLAEPAPGYWTADVSGVKDYLVQVTVKDDEIVKTYCDCPHEIDFCKHVVATLYAITAKIKRQKMSAGEPGDFNSLVSMIPESMLRDFITSYAASDPQFRKRVEELSVNTAKTAIQD